MNDYSRLANKEASATGGKIVSFERDINYYFQKGNKYFLKNNFRKALLYFKKTVELEPLNALNHYNLACLLSKMGQLEEANRVFSYIVDELDPSLSECYFLMAINYGLLEELEIARYYLYLYLEESPEGEMAEEARELYWALGDGEEIEVDMQEDEGKAIEGREFLEKKEEVLGEINRWKREEFEETYNNSVFFRQSLKKMLYFAQDRETEDIIRLFGLLNNKEARHTLKEFVRSPWIKDRLKLWALLKLKNMNSLSRCHIYLNGNRKKVDLNRYPLQAPRWKEEWERVLVCVLNQMRKNNTLNDEVTLETVQALWLGFLNKKHPQEPRIMKPEAWAAGLEYCMSRHYLLEITQKEISQKYGVSSSSVGNKYRQITSQVEISRDLFTVPELQE